MKRMTLQLAPILVSAILVTAGASHLNAQITDTIRAHLDHSFVVGEKTFPPGEYTFRMVSGSDLMVMRVTNDHTHDTADFSVIDSKDTHTPAHSEIVFRKFGNTEFLYKVYEIGSKDGVRLTESSKREMKFVNAGEQGVEHTEEQK